MRPRIDYDFTLKSKARNLRTAMTDCERIIWSRLRRKPLVGVQFYRQKPLGHYIVNRYAPKSPHAPICKGGIQSRSTS